MIILKKSLLFANQSQYGYHIDYVQYCKYLKSDFDIIFFCWDYGREKISETDIKIYYISRKGNIIKRNIRFIIKLLNYINHSNNDFVFIHYFIGSSLITLFAKDKKKLHLDIRTGSDSQNVLKRNIYNSVLRIESLFYKSKSIISLGLRNLLHISKTSHILPLGANPSSIQFKCQHRLHLLYVGTFDNRRIEDTINGFYLFLEQNTQADIHYTIVGSGMKNESENLQRLIIQKGLQSYIDLTGYVLHHQLSQFYELSNAGVSYIPRKPYYEFQPATKTFEYLMSGMPVIATQTYENKQIINELNGILINDSPISFANGIHKLYNSIHTFDKNEIKKSVKNYEWERIVDAMKKTILPK